jgi:hypothetical protein
LFTFHFTVCRIHHDPPTWKMKEYICALHNIQDILYYSVLGTSIPSVFTLHLLCISKYCITASTYYFPRYLMICIWFILSRDDYFSKPMTWNQYTLWKCTETFTLLATFFLKYQIKTFYLLPWNWLHSTPRQKGTEAPILGLSKAAFFHVWKHLQKPPSACTVHCTYNVYLACFFQRSMRGGRLEKFTIYRKVIMKGEFQGGFSETGGNFKTFIILQQ